MTPEAKIKKAFVDETRKVGLCYINLIETGDDGNPDKIALPPGGRPAFIEFKRERGGVLSPEQNDKIRRYRSLGYPVYIISTKSHAVAIARGLMKLARLGIPKPFEICAE